MNNFQLLLFFLIESLKSLVKVSIILRCTSESTIRPPFFSTEGNLQLLWQNPGKFENSDWLAGEWAYNAC